MDNLTGSFGLAGDQPVTGDWNADTVDNIGVYRPNRRRFYLDFNGNRNWEGAAGGDAISAIFGLEGDQPVAGDWNSDSADKIGGYRPANRRFYLDANGNRAWNGAVGGDAITGQFLPTLLLAADGLSEKESNASLSAEELRPIVTAATDLLSDSGLGSTKLETLSRVQFVVDDLNGARVGKTLGNTVIIDNNAAGHGWFVDATPTENEEFDVLGPSGLMAAGDSAASGRIDLLTVVLHELQHVLGSEDFYSEVNAHDLMNGSLAKGVRRVPTQS